jgi:membrane protease YdiL (CAAX protease family)
MKQNYRSNSKISRFWNSLPVMIRATITGFLVSTIGVTLWAADVRLVWKPLALPIIFILLWFYWKYFSGTKWLAESMAARRRLFRVDNSSIGIRGPGLLGAFLFVVIIQSSFVISFRLVDMPVAFSSGYPILETLPSGLAWAILIASSVVAGICEETGFRGYMQVPLEKKYGPRKAILYVSLIFSMIHLGKVWAAPIIPNIFLASVLLGVLAYKTRSLIPGMIGHSILDIFDYSFWWTHLMGNREMATIFKTGIDLHFLTWSLIFIGGIIGFYWTMLRLKDSKKKGDVK